MLQNLECVRTRSQISQIQKLDTNIIAIATQLHGVKIINCEDCQNVASITHEHLNAQVESISFSPNAEFMSFSNQKYIFIFHIPSKIILKTIKTDGEYIQHLQFDSDSKYIIASTKSGRVLQYRYDGSSLLARLYSFAPTQTNIKVNARSFAFHSNMLACGASDGSILTMNLHSRANKSLIHNSKASISSVFFQDSTHIISADVKGSIYFNSVKNKTLIKKMESCFTKIIQILALPNPNYMLVVSEEKNVALYDIINYKLLDKKYLEFEDSVKKIILADNETLLVALENNNIEKIKLPKADKLKSFIISNSLDKAYILVQKDPLLRATKEYKVLEIAYAKIYALSLEALSKGNIQRAQELTKMFKYIDEKKEDLSLLFKSFENYPRFKVLYSEKKFALAYAMGAKFPALCQTFQYKKMEEIWEETFKNAQRQIAHGRLENAVTLLSEYATVMQKRPIIKLVLQHNSDFIEFMGAMESKNFKKIASLVKRNSLFTLIPTYKEIEPQIELSLDNIQKNITKCKLEDAITELSKLQNIDSISEKVSLLKEECKAVKRLQDAYKVNDFLKCFEIIDSHNVLNSTNLGTLLQTHWTKIISKSEEFALKGNIKEIQNILGELIHLKTRRDKIGDLFRLAFHTKIKGLMHKKLPKKAESIIYSYIDIFGIDREIISIMNLFEKYTKSKLAITHNARADRNKWIHSPSIMGEAV